jgi:hypothetical protein
LNLLVLREQWCAFRTAPRSGPLLSALSRSAYEICQRTEQEEDAEHQEFRRRGDLVQEAKGKLKENRQYDQTNGELHQKCQGSLGVKQVTKTHFISSIHKFI